MSDIVNNNADKSPNSNELTESRVNLGSRKYQDVVFLGLFLIGLLVHFVITTILISSANAYIPHPRFDFPERCPDHSYCYWEDSFCPFGQATLRGSYDYSDVTCENPCVIEGYVFLINHCIDQASLDLTLAKKCHAEEQGVSMSDSRRRLDWNSKRGVDVRPMLLMDGVEDSAGLIVGIVAFTFIMAGVWGYLLQKHSVKVVWATIGIEIVVALGLSVYLLTEEQKEPAFVLLGFTAGGSTLVVKFRKKITLSAQLIGEACTALRTFPTVLGYGMLIKSVWILYSFYSLYAIYESQMIVAVSNNCGVSQQDWVTSYYMFLFLMLGWVTTVFNQIRTGAVAGTVALWFFHLGADDMPSHPARQSMKWAVTTSLGTHAFSGLLLEFVSVLQRLAQRKVYLLFAGPPGWILFCLISALAKFLDILTKYATVFHVFTGDPLLQSGKRTYNLMKRHFTTGIVAASVGQKVLTLAAIIISYCITWISFISLLAYYDQLEHAKFLRDANWSKIIPLGFLVVALMPKFTAFSLVLVFYNTVDIGLVPAEFVALILALVMSVFSNIVLRYMADIINDALATVFVCYGIGKDNAVVAPRVMEIERLINIVVPASIGRDGTTVITPV